MAVSDLAPFRLVLELSSTEPGVYTVEFPHSACIGTGEHEAVCQD